MNESKLIKFYQSRVKSDYILNWSKAISDFLTKNPPESDPENENPSLRKKKFTLLYLLDYLTYPLTDYIDRSLPSTILVKFKSDQALTLDFYDALDLVISSNDNPHARYYLEELERFLIALLNRIEIERALMLQRN